MPSILRLALTLSRASNLPTVWTNCLAAWAINQSVEKIVGQTPAWHDPTLFDWGVLGWLLLGASLVYSGGCVLNDAFDQKFDKQYNPNRPIPSGQINPSSVWVMGILFLIIGGGVWAFSGFHSLDRFADWSGLPLWLVSQKMDWFGMDHGELPNFFVVGSRVCRKCRNHEYSDHLCVVCRRICGGH